MNSKSLEHADFISSMGTLSSVHDLIASYLCEPAEESLSASSVMSHPSLLNISTFGRGYVMLS